MNGEQDKRERLDELLATRAVEGLDAGETLELEALLAELDEVDPWRYEEAAAAFWVATVDADHALPDDVARRVESRLSAEAAGEDSNVVAVTGRQQERAPARGPATGTDPGRTGGVRGASPNRWPWLATAAALVLAVIGWWPQGPGGADGSGQPETLAEARDRLLEEAPDAVKVEWDATDHPLAKGVSGHVVWSESRQEGYMTFKGIPDNDPDENQYQLWVFDDQRSEQYPVDGGVFNAPEGGDEVVIPIETRLPVKDADLFAVTMEPPGGVVVSDRDPILWVAKPDEGEDESGDAGAEDGGDGQEEEGI